MLETGPEQLLGQHCWFYCATPAIPSGTDVKVTAGTRREHQSALEEGSTAQLPGEAKGRVPEALSWRRAVFFQPTCLQGFNQDEAQGLGGASEHIRRERDW